MENVKKEDILHTKNHDYVLIAIGKPLNKTIMFLAYK